MTPTPGARAIVTGASSGIGAALAPLLAAEGYDLVLVARRADRLEALAETIRAEHGREVSVLALDITCGSALEDLQAIAPSPALLINNAGVGRFGSAVKGTVAEQSQMVRLNCEALTTLTLGYLPRMIEQGEGVIVNMASIAGFQPLPYFAVYGATKAYVISLTEALDEEFTGTGVRLVAVCPGPVHTEFQQNAGSPDARSEPSYNLRSPQQIAEATLAAIRKPKRIVTVAAYHRFMHFVQRFVPRSTVVGIAGKKMRKRPQ